MSSRKKKLTDALLWPVLMLVLITSLLAALHWYMSLNLGGFPFDAFAPGFLLLAAAFQALALCMAAIAWHMNLQLQGIQKLSLLQSLVMTGFSAIGKYIPGKIWGMLARGVAFYRISPQKDRIVLATLIEQLALLHSGLIMAALAFLAIQGHTAGIGLLILISVPSVWWVASGGSQMLRLIRLLDRKKQLGNVWHPSDLRKSYPAVFLSLAFMWFMVVLALWFCVQAYGGEADMDLALVVLATVLSYLGSFAAFFSPAGLGVREGIIVAMLGPHVGVSAALYISVLHRLITAGCDVALGIVSLLFVNANPDKVSVNDDS